jgi:hypothetical protein
MPKLSLCRTPLCLVAVSFFALASVRADELVLTAADLYRMASMQGVELSADGKSLMPSRGQLIESDGEAAGYSYKPQEETLGPDIEVVKVFQINLLRHIHPPHSDNDPQRPPKAYLLVGHMGKSLKAAINGRAIELGEPAKVGNYWKKFEIPTKWLKHGKNHVSLTGEGKLWIARQDDQPNPLKPRLRRQQSYKWDKGVRWDRLGPNNDIAGEYYVRLYLDGYMDNFNYLELPVFDAASLAGKSIAPPRVKVKRIHVSVDSDWPEPADGASISISSHSHLGRVDSTFSSSPLLMDTNEFTLEGERVPRFFSVSLTLPAKGVSQPTHLRSVRISTEVEPIESDGTYEISGRSNELLSRFDLNELFEFESLDHPKLKQLREQYKLDEVVKGCTTDLQRMEKLAVWSSQQWTKGHLKEAYPPWDALEILKKHADGTPVGGFCQQYNLVFLQACQSFGMVGRCVSISSGDHGLKIRSGHEVVEIWSNDLNKWIYVDGQAAWYFVDQESREPLNLLELRERQLAHFQGRPFRPAEVVVLGKSPYEWKGFGDFPAFAELRMIPHTKFLDGDWPLPVNQGMRGWFWTGFRVLTDDQYPASILYPSRIHRAADWNFPLHQCEIRLQRTDKPGRLQVYLLSGMPSFNHYLVQTGDMKERMVKEQKLEWPLQPGENRIQVRAVSKLLVHGPPSWITVKYTPNK